MAKKFAPTTLRLDIAGRVAAMTESKQGIFRVKQPPKIPLVDRDSATRWARRLAVQFDVGELLLRS
jgi:hypothetical protein